MKSRILGRKCDVISPWCGTGCGETSVCEGRRRQTRNPRPVACSNADATLSSPHPPLKRRNYITEQCIRKDSQCAGLEKESCLISIDSQNRATTTSRTQGELGPASTRITNYDCEYVMHVLPAPFILIFSLFTLTPLKLTLAPIGRRSSASFYK